MDFKDLKDRILIVDVLYRYNVRLRKRPDSEYASTACPLPTHPSDDRSNNAFGVHLPTNRWQCKHPVCARINGVGNKWGDCINLVMTMSRMGFKEAANQLDSWFPNKKPAPLIGAPEDRRDIATPSHHIRDNTSSSGSVKYMASIEIWFDEVWKRLDGETEEDHRKRFLKNLKSRLIESYRAGQLAKAG